MANTFQLEILTPERHFFSGQVDALTFEAPDGQWTILKSHAPMIAALRAGTVKFRVDGVWKEAVNSEGYMEISAAGIILFAQTCEWARGGRRQSRPPPGEAGHRASAPGQEHERVQGQQAAAGRAMARLRNSKSQVNLD